MLSRRDFLRLLGGAGLLLIGSRFARLPLAGPLDRPDGNRTRSHSDGRSGPARPDKASLVIALLSDTHVQDPAGAPAAAGVNGKLGNALADLTSLRPDLYLFNGDVSDNGLPGEYAAFHDVVRQAVPDAALAVTTGNHEFYDSSLSDQEVLSRFCEQFGYDRPYSSLVLGDVHLVLLADEMRGRAPRNPEWAWLGQEQVRWFRRVLKEHRHLDTVVCLHQSLPDTVAWSYGNNSFNGCGQATELRGILRENPQVKLWLSGHTHLPLETEGQVHQDGGVTFAALGSTFYQFKLAEGTDPSRPRGGWTKDFAASQNRVLEVYPERLILRAWDHRRRAWLEDLTVEVPRGA